MLVICWTVDWCCWFGYFGLDLFGCLWILLFDLVLLYAWCGVLLSWLGWVLLCLGFVVRLWALFPTGCLVYNCCDFFDGGVVVLIYLVGCDRR